MPQHCAAYSCLNRRTIASRARGITFHKFPKDKDVRKKWQVALRRKGFTATDSSVLCSQHFKQSDIDKTGQNVRLRDGVIPSVFSFPVHLQRLEKARATSTSRRAEESLSMASQDSQEMATSHPLPQPNDDHGYALPASPTALKTRLNEALARVESLEQQKKNAMAREKRKGVRKMAQLSHIMGLLVESAVMEMGRLLDGCAAVLEGHENTVLKSEMERVNSINMVKFSSYMEVLSKSSVEQISLLLNIEEVDVTAVESSEAEAVISVNPEVKSGIVIIGQLHEIGEAVGTLSVPVKEERSSFESDNQEEDPDPRDVEWLPDDDPSLTPNINPISPSSTRPKTHRSLLDRAKQDPSRSEEDPDVQCGSSLICSHCGKCFKKKWDLTRHTQTHTKPYNCSKCGKGFNLAKRLEEHSKKHTGTRDGLANQQNPQSREKKYCCDSCGKTFFTTWCLKAHMTTHTTKDHSCSVCGTSFNNGNALRKHRLVTHPGETPSFICDVCGKCFAKRDHLYKHMLRHKEEKPYSCDDCGKRFHSSSNCKRHKMTHTGEKLYSCEICGKSFTQSGTLLKHKLSKHTDGEEKPFKCEICSEVCSSHYTLRNHMVTHTGKKPCHCSVCGKGFFNKQALKIHLLVHSGEKPYGCGQCGKRFSQPSHLKYHEHHVHTVVKACVCDICGKAYANRQNLKLHKCAGPAKPEVFELHN